MYVNFLEFWKSVKVVIRSSGLPNCRTGKKEKNKKLEKKKRKLGQ
jgi:hypothetical protein